MNEIDEDILAMRRVGAMAAYQQSICEINDGAAQKINANELILRSKFFPLRKSI